MQNPEEPLEVREETVEKKGVFGRIRSIVFKVIKWSTVVFFSLLIFVILTLSFVLFTHTGSEFTWNRVKGFVDGIDGDLTYGNLANGFTMENFRLDIEDSIHIDAGKLEIKYSVWDLLYGHLNVRYLKTSDILLVLGNKPVEFPGISDILEKRLYENYSFALNEQGDMVRIRESAKEPDPTLIYMPAPDVNPYVEAEEEVEDDGERFVLDMPVNLSVKNIEIDRFLMLSNIIDVAVKRCTASASMNHTVLNVDYLNIEYGDSLLHGDDRDALLARRAGGEQITYESLLSLHPEYTAESARRDNESAEEQAVDSRTENSGDVSVSETERGLEKTAETADVKTGKKPEEKTPVQVSADVQASSETPASEDELPLNDPYDRDEIHKRIEPLYTVILPFDLYVEKVTLTNTRYHMDSFDTGIFNGGFKMNFVGPDLHVDHLYFDHELGHAELNDSDMTFKEYYPIEAHLKASSNNPDWFGLLHNHTLDANVTGDLADLKGGIHAVGAIDADVIVRSNVLAPTLPFSADIDVRHALWPLDADVIEYSAESLKLHADGSLQSVAADITASGIRALDYPVLDLHGVLNTDFGSVDISEFRVNSDIGDSLDVSGKAIWSDQYSFDGKVDANVVELARYLPDYEGNVNLGITSYVHFQNSDDWVVKVSRLDADGRLMNYPLSLTSGRFELNSSRKGIIEGVHLAVGDENTLDISGKIQKTADLHVSLDVQDISVIMPDYYGLINGVIRITGDFESPTIDAKIYASEFIAEHYHVYNAALELQAFLKNMVLADSKLSLYMDELRKGKDSYIKDFNLDFNGGESKHHLLMKSDTIAGPVTLGFDGGLNKARDLYIGSVSELTAKARDVAVSLVRPVNFRMKLAPDFSASLNGHAWSVNDVLINVSDGYYSSAASEINLEIPKLDLMRFKKFLPESFMIDKPLDIFVKAGTKHSQPFASFRLREDANALYYNRERLDIDRLGLNAELSKDNLTSSIRIDLGKLGYISTDFNVNQLSSKKIVSGSLDISNLNLILAEKFSEEVTSANGILSARGTYGGTLDNPAFYGQLKINEMNVFPSAGIGMIEHINSTMDVDGRKASITSSFSFNDKYGKINGNVSWEKGLDAVIRVDTEELPVQLMGYGNALVKLDITGKFTDRYGSIDGTVDIPSAKIKVKELPASSVSASSDITEYYKNKDGMYVDNEENSMPFRMNIKVNLGPEIKVNALGLKSYLKGSLTLAQRPRRPMTLNGKIEMIDGTFHAYGQNLLIEQGRILFVGDPASPNLNIRAIRNPQSMEDDNIMVGIKVTGNANSPTVSIFSRPEMNQSEALSYLLRGKGLDQTSGSSDMATQLLLGVGLMQTNSIVGRMGEVVGLEDVSLDSKGEGDDTSVEVSAYILPKVQVAYGYGIYNAVSEFRIRYEMFPRFYIEALSSIEQAVDAVYKFDFDFWNSDSAEKTDAR